MHEWALAEAVAAAAVKVADDEGLKRITEVRVRVGELQRIEPDVLRFALGDVIVKTEPRLKGARVDLEIEPARFRCRPCGKEWPLAEAVQALGADDAENIHFVPELVHLYVRCPACASPDFEVTEGRGVSLASVAGED